MAERRGSPAQGAARAPLVAQGAARALLVGLGASGEAVARHLLARGWTVVAVDDTPGEAGRGHARRLGVELVEAPFPERLDRLVAGADMVVPSPGVPASHPVFGLAAGRGVPVRVEVELAWRATDLPMVAVTGTNGKTTVTTLVTRMLEESGVAAVAGGNIGLPLCDAVESDVDVVVAEVSSFQLQFVEAFRPAVAVWLNLAQDHLDWHPDLASYVAAKARIWEHQDASDVAVVNAEDQVVMAAAEAAPSAVVTFGLGEVGGAGAGDYSVVDGMLRAPAGDLLPVAALPRALPHDVSNALAAAAAALAAGATVEGVRAALAGFGGLPHRLTLVAENGGVRWYDDSKATNPHAAVAAVCGFESVVLVAGGRNKGLDLRPLAAAADRVRAVVAIGEAAPEVGAAFAGVRPVRVAESMDAAVRLAAAEASAGDAVLLSPGCASFDWYSSYAARGDDFARAVRDFLLKREVGNGIEN